MRSPAVLLVAVLAVAALSACGSDAGSDSSGDSPKKAAGTSLTIEVVADEGAAPRTYELTCDPAGGDHPQAEQGCAALAQAGAEVLDPVPADQSCTTIYGGPQTATVNGTYGGKDVDATFNRQNGCEIDRWEKLGTTFFNIPLQ